MKKAFIGLVLGLVFSSCLFCRDFHYIKVVNNTEETQFITIGFSGIGIDIEPEKEFEFKSESEKLDIHHNKGWIYERDVNYDVTIEFNPSCYYVNETRFEYRPYEAF